MRICSLQAYRHL